MKFQYLWFFCLTSLFLLSSCGGGSSSKNSDTLEQGASTEFSSPAGRLPGTLIIIGDSIMAGCIESIDQPEPDYTMTTAHLVAQRGIRVVNLSRSGNSITLANTQRAEGGVNFTQGGDLGTAIWISLGVNDFLWGQATMEEFRDGYLKLLGGIEPIASQKVFCVTPLMSRFDYEHKTNGIGESLEDFRQVVRDIAADEHCALVDTSDWFSSSEIYDDCNMPDKVHLGKEGHEKYAAKLLDEIRDGY